MPAHRRGVAGGKRGGAAGALATLDPAWREPIAAPELAIDAREFAAEAGPARGAGRPCGWGDRGAAPEQIRAAPRDARLLYVDAGSRYWSSGGGNWLGRLLELVRSEMEPPAR
jgi:hypothetical protein